MGQVDYGNVSCDPSLVKTRVVWAIQSPTLLNRLAKGSWVLEAADFGDASFSERQQLAVPTWDGRADGVAACFVCSPDHVRNARERLPGVPIMRVAHQGYHQKLPACDESVGTLCFAEAIRDFVGEAVVNKPVWVIRPAFEVKPVWQWGGRFVWSMMSRPKTRERIAMAGFESVAAIAKTQLRMFGEDQPEGALSGEARDRLMLDCSAYLTALEPRTGFGLAEHEAMSMGCPVIGNRWCDMAWLKARGEKVPSLGFRDYGDIYTIAEIVDRVARDMSFAEEISEEETEYVACRYTSQQMNLGIEAFLDTVGGA